MAGDPIKGFFKRLVLPIGIIMGILVVIPLVARINDAGQRTVIQYPTGTLEVRFEPGIYMLWFGRSTVYRDVITYDFDKTNAQG